MTQLLNRYQQAVLAELNIPIFLHHQSSSDLYELNDDSAEQAEIQSAPASSETSVLSNTIPADNQHTENHSAISSQPQQQATHLNEASTGAGQLPEPLTDTQAVNHQQQNAEPSAVEQTQTDSANIHPNQNSVDLNQVAAEPQKNDNIDVIADKLTNASLQDATNEQDQEQLERDKTIADKTKAINQLAAILPTTTASADNGESDSQVSAEFELGLTGIEAIDLSILQVWAHQNDWTFEQDSQGRVTAYHPKLSQHMNFDLSQPADKKSCWKLILSCVE